MRIFLYCFTALSVLVSCKKDTNDNPGKNTFIAYNLNGASCNGAFRIETDKDMTTLEVTAFVIPATPQEPEVIFITFYDFADGREVAFIIPRGSNPALLVHDSPYGMGIIHQVDGCSLTSGVENTLNGVSVEIKNFKAGSGALGFNSPAYMEGYFVGVMSYKNEMNEIEQHTVEGDFVYNQNDVY